MDISHRPKEKLTKLVQMELLCKSSMLLRPLHVDVVLCNQQEIAIALLLSKRTNISH
jgi:hypothetical protein